MTKELEAWFDNHVVATAQEFLDADSRLCKVSAGLINADLDEARMRAERKGKQAAAAIFSFPEHAFAAKPAWLPGDLPNDVEVKKWLQATHDKRHRSEPISDLTVIEGVANAYKHTRAKRHPVTDAGTLAAARPYGSLGFGEGWNGGGEMIIVRWPPPGRKRSLATVVSSVVGMWERAMGRPQSGLDESGYRGSD